MLHLPPYSPASRPRRHLASRPAPPKRRRPAVSGSAGRNLLPGVQRRQGRSRYESARRTRQPSVRRAGTVTRCGASQPLLPVASARNTCGHRAAPCRPRATARRHLISSDRNVGRTPPGGPAGLSAGVRTSATSGSRAIIPRSAGRPWRCWQAGHTSRPQASVPQPAASALARLSASPSAAGSANREPQPAMSHQAAGTRIWSPMTQCSVIATGWTSGSRCADSRSASRSADRPGCPGLPIRPAQPPALWRRACLARACGPTRPSRNVTARRHQERRPGAGTSWEYPGADLDPSWTRSAYGRVPLRDIIALGPHVRGGCVATAVQYQA